MYEGKFYKLDTHKAANCCVYVRRKDGRAARVSLWSYSTDVCGIYLDEVDDAWHVYCTGTYSQTTRKHISWFARELRYADATCKIDYFTFKYIFDIYRDAELPQRPCWWGEAGAAIRLADHYTANCRPIL